MNVNWLGKNQDYRKVLALQETLWEKQTEASDQFSPELLLLEHASVYTMGRTRDQSSLRDREKLPYPVEEINRGGQATYHGPGQLVGYVMANLNHLGRDIHLFVDGMEKCLIQACADYGVQARQREGLIGVWVEDRKLASIGIGVRRWVTMHGFAINLTRESVIPFHYITPCGLDNVTITYLEGEMKRNTPDAQVPAAREFGNRFSQYFADFLLSIKKQDSPENPELP